MRLGEAEVASAQHGTSTYFSHIQVPVHQVLVNVASCLFSWFSFFPSRICWLVVWQRTPQTVSLQKKPLPTHSSTSSHLPSHSRRTSPFFLLLCFMSPIIVKTGSLRRRCSPAWEASVPSMGRSRSAAWPKVAALSSIFRRWELPSVPWLASCLCALTTLGSRPTRRWSGLRTLPEITYLVHAQSASIHLTSGDNDCA